MTYPKIDLNTHRHNPHSLKKWWIFQKLNQFNPVNLIKINWHFTSTLENTAEIDSSKNFKIWAGVPLPGLLLKIIGTYKS